MVLVPQDAQANRFYGVGRLAGEPTLYEAKNGVKYARVWLWLNEYRKLDRDGRRRRERFRVLVTVLGQPSQRFAAYAHAGDLVQVEGHLEEVAMRSAQGVMFPMIAVQAFQWGFLGRSQEEGADLLAPHQDPTAPDPTPIS